MNKSTVPIGLATMKVVRRLGINGRLFQAQDVRVELGYDESSEQAHYMHAVLYRLKKDGVIENIDPSRKRNQYLKVSRDKEEELRARIDRMERPLGKSFAQPLSVPPASSSDESPSPTQSAPRRVVYLEERVTELEGIVPKLREELDDRFEEVNRKLNELASEVRTLVALWA